ncbi:MAG: AAA family ATPase, partial [Rubrobacter sp.]|nr:AAA family ATPase [Rubrobacter sp.]
LKKLPVAGKLFGSTGSSGASGSANAAAYEGAHSRDEQGIANKPSPQEVESRLALALRETSIDGFSKIAVGSPKGGVGKSSLAYAIGCAIANHTNIRVCLVDADPEFGATRSLVPRPVPYSIVELARDADELHRLSDIRNYVAQNERMRLDVLLNPSEMIHKAQIGDLPTAYERIDDALSRFYDLVNYDMGIGFSHPQIQKILSLSDELLLVGDSEVVPNDIFGDALSYLQGLDFSLDNATLAISHRLPPTDESATTGLVKSEHATKLRRVTEIPYDASFSQLLNRRAFRVDALSLQTRLGILTTAAASLEGLRSNTAGPRKKG